MEDKSPIVGIIVKMVTGIIVTTVDLAVSECYQFWPSYAQAWEDNK